jgi:hypothetical protein
MWVAAACQWLSVTAVCHGRSRSCPSRLRAAAIPRGRRLGRSVTAVPHRCPPCRSPAALSQGYPSPLSDTDFHHAVSHSRATHVSSTALTCPLRPRLTAASDARAPGAHSTHTHSTPRPFRTGTPTQPLHSRPRPTRLLHAPGIPAARGPPALEHSAIRDVGRAVPLIDSAVSPEIRADLASLWPPCGWV